VKHIVRKSPIYESFRVQAVKGMFDCPHKDFVTHEWDVDLPFDKKPWLIGLIVGSSGSGKSTIAQELFPEAYHHTQFDWPQKRALVDGFEKGLELKSIVEVLSSVGFSSPPHWLKPYSCLSNGQKFRAELARLLLCGHKQVVFDEFTSIVDRDSAKICCAAMAKALRKRGAPQIVAASCHFDIIDWLQPDWIYEVGGNCFSWRVLQQRPAIELRIHKADTGAWRIFKGHHYLSKDIHRSAACFVATWNNKPIAFSSVIYFPHPKVQNFRREHRTVVLPDFQGVGIGNALSEAIAEHYKAQGARFISVTSHPAMIWHRAKSPLWRCTRGLKRSSARRSNCNPASRHPANGRLCAGFEFVGK